MSDEAGAASVVMDYTTPSDDWTMLGVPLKPASAGTTHDVDVSLGVAAGQTYSVLADFAPDISLGISSSIVNSTASNLDLDVVLGMSAGLDSSTLVDYAPDVSIGINAGLSVSALADMAAGISLGINADMAYSLPGGIDYTRPDLDLISLIEFDVFPASGS